MTAKPILLGESPTEPITYAWGPYAETIADAGYRAYHDGMPPRPWESLTGVERHRWLLAAEQVHARPGTTDAPTLRAVYLVGYRDVAWDDLGTRYRQRWHRIRAAMVAACTAWRVALERERAARIGQAARKEITIEVAARDSLRDRLKERRREAHA